MTDKQKIIEKLDALSLEEWADVVGTAAHNRYATLRQTNSNAATFYDIQRSCQRLRKIMKRAVIG